MQGLYYQEPAGSTVWQCPPLLQAAIDALYPVDKMARFLEDEAVTVFQDEIIFHAVAQLNTHSHDAGIAGALLNGLGKIAGNTANHRALVGSDIIVLAVTLMASMPDDLHVCESAANLLLPFSFNLDFTRIISDAGAVPVFVAVTVRSGGVSWQTACCSPNAVAAFGCCVRKLLCHCCCNVHRPVTQRL